jgi:hypothetical protein
VKALASSFMARARAALRPASRHATRPQAAGSTATIDYFLAMHLRDLPPGRWIVVPDGGDPGVSLRGAGRDTGIVINRYLPGAWEHALRTARRNGARVVYFMDDDLLDASAVDELPAPYRRRVRREALHQSETIRSLASEIWVSTPYLERKYRTFGARRLSPRPLAATLAQHQASWVCYHGTASHQQEFDWLLPVLRGVRVGCGGVRFEVFGDHQRHKAFRDVEGMTVLHPMTWSNYLDYTGSIQRDVALAPLLPSRFNAARGPTKFFDHTRMGAVGIYTDVEPYRGFIRDGVDGILLPNEPALWVRTIVDLANDAPRRERMVAAARERALAMAD